MAKSKNKGNTAPAKDMAGAASKAAETASLEFNDIPNFDETAMNNLAQKINAQFKLPQGAKQSKQRQPKAKTENKTSPIADVKIDKKPEPKVVKKQTEDAQQPAKGKKRTINGDVKQEKAGGKKDVGKKDAGQKDAGKKNADEALRAEILALGGSEEDLKLLAGVDSDTEEGDEVLVTKDKGKAADAKLLGDIEKMVREMGSVPAAQKDASSDDENDFEVEDMELDEEDEIDEDEESEDEPVIQKQIQKQIATPKINSKFLVQPRPDWYAAPLGEIQINTSEIPGMPKFLLDRVSEYATQLLDEENNTYASDSATSSSSKFYATIMSSGTLSDKISALTLAVQESPLHNVKALENLVGLAKKRSRSQAVEVLRALKDSFAHGTILPSDRKLKHLSNQPALAVAFSKAGFQWREGDLPKGLTKQHLITWAFEEKLKGFYFEVLKVLEVWCSDEIEFARARAVSYVYELLKEKPEQEANLLRLLVNKLGDPNKKIASRASYLLLQLEEVHPMMKTTIIAAIESEFLFKPGQTQHAKYYAIITLNQTSLSVKDENVALKLLDIYFGLFVTLLKPAADKKALPKANAKKDNKKGNKKDGKKDAPADENAQEEELREKVVSGVLTGVNRAYPYITSDTEKLSKHMDTLFRITHSSNFNTSIQALMLIQQITSSYQVSADRFYRTLYESLLDPRVVTSSKQALYLNLLFKSLKEDMNVKRVKAFVKRILQVLNLHGPSFVCGAFFLVRELEKQFPSLSTLIDQPEEDDSDDEEVFHDVPDEDDIANEKEPARAREIQAAEPKIRVNRYDSRKRDPEHSNADKSCLWELTPFLSHFHPSVSLSADSILRHKPMSGKPDLTIHTLSHFLDRFVYRNNKGAASAPRGSSVMQPLAGKETADRLLLSNLDQNRQSVNTENFWRKNVEDVAAEDVFFHSYFSKLGKSKLARVAKAEKKKAKKGREADEIDDDGSGDENDEAEIWKALVDSRPEVEGNISEDEADFDSDDFEAEMESGDEDMEDESDGEVEFFDDSDGGVGVDEEEQEEEEVKPSKKTKDDKKKPSKKEAPPVDSDSDESDFAFDDSDEEAFVDSDDEVPFDLELAAPPSDDEAEKTGKSANESKRAKRRKLKSLPTFASVEDYAKMLEDEDDGMGGM